MRSTLASLLIIAVASVLPAQQPQTTRTVITPPRPFTPIQSSRATRQLVNLAWPFSLIGFPLAQSWRGRKPASERWRRSRSSIRVR